MFASHVTFIPILLLHAGLGVFVLLRNPANTINRRFCIFAQTFSVWVFFIFFAILMLVLKVIFPVFNLIS